VILSLSLGALQQFNLWSFANDSLADTKAESERQALFYRSFLPVILQEAVP